jgi:hypothetical protein
MLLIGPCGPLFITGMPGAFGAAAAFLAFGALAGNPFRLVAAKSCSC